MQKFNSSKNKLMIFAFAVAFAAAAFIPMLLPTSVGAQSGVAHSTVVTTEGTLAANGQYAQNSGNYVKLAEGTPIPTPTPGDCESSPNSPGGKIYVGDYSLTNGENGKFVLVVNNGTNQSTGTAAPEELPENPRVIEQGNAVVTLQVNTTANTGTGTIRFTSGGTTVNGTITITNGVEFPPSPGVVCGSPNNSDYDGDGKADLGVFRPSNGTWYFNRLAGGYSGIAFGQNGDKPVSADYDGDGKTDVAVYRSGVWYILQSATNQVRYVTYGTANDMPRPGDYDGDGKADIGVFRPSTGIWYYIRSSDNTSRGLQFGQNGDVPMLADFDGDRKTDIAVFRPSNGVWYRINSSDGAVNVAAFGQNGDIPLNGDFSGDGKADLAVYRPSTGTWYVARQTGAPAQNFNAISFGTATDTPVPADYDGDGKTDIAVFRAGSWYLINSHTDQITVAQFGQMNDRPVQSAIVQ